MFTVVLRQKKYGEKTRLNLGRLPDIDAAI